MADEQKQVTDERRQHLELIAASLTQSYYSVHTAGARDHREIMDTYRFLLDALVEQEGLPPGHSALSASDGLAPFVEEKTRNE
jgi:hypothetical protein